MLLRIRLSRIDHFKDGHGYNIEDLRSGDNAVEELVKAGAFQPLT